MQKPGTIQYLFIDADGFFASCEQQVNPALRGRPIGIVPFNQKTDHTVIIACSKDAKRQGVKNIMNVREAKKICPEIILVPQNPEIYRRAHNALCSSIESVIPIEARKSIDELTCRLDAKDIKDPLTLARNIKRAIKKDIGLYVTVSIGFASNRHLAKIACKMDKPNGVTVWPPEIMPAPLYPLTFDDIPGIGTRMSIRLWKSGIYSVKSFLESEPKQVRKIWKNVTGERLWYALHGYDIRSMPTERGMYGHGRVLPPEQRTTYRAYGCVRILTIKAARRMRRDGYYATSLNLWLLHRSGYKDNKSWGGKTSLQQTNDDQACLAALNDLWAQALTTIEPGNRIIRIGVYYGGLVPAGSRQYDLFFNDDHRREKWEGLTSLMDDLNMRYGRSVITMGPWDRKAKHDNIGTKIAFSRIPSAEDWL